VSEDNGPFFSFTVIGTPKSTGGGGRRSRQNVRSWIEKVRSAAETVLHPPGPLSGEPLAVRITYFFWGATDLDVDNIAKPILDALKSIVYNDDRQVEELTVRKTDHSHWLGVSDAAPELLALLYRERQFIHVRCFGPPDHGVVR
jgi:hypothetical protein